MNWEADATEIRKQRGLGDYKPLRPYVAKAGGALSGGKGPGGPGEDKKG
jgi:hypothetical protein